MSFSLAQLQQAAAVSVKPVAVWGWVLVAPGLYELVPVRSL